MTISLSIHVVCHELSCTCISTCSKAVQCLCQNCELSSDSSGPSCSRVDNTIHWTNHYLWIVCVDKTNYAIHWIMILSVDSIITLFEQLEPDFLTCNPSNKLAMYVDSWVVILVIVTNVQLCWPGYLDKIYL